MPPLLTSPILTDAHLADLLRALTRGQGTYTPEDAEVLLHWTEETLLRAAMVRHALQGTLGLTVTEGQVYGRFP